MSSEAPNLTQKSTVWATEDRINIKISFYLDRDSHLNFIMEISIPGKTGFILRRSPRGLTEHYIYERYIFL